jgi:putative endonuclease
MAKHQQTGQKGEALAAQFLAERGYQILHQNWRFSYYEVDIIAQKDNILHIIEVKTRRNSQYGYPEESVTDQKLESLMKAAEAFLQEHPEWNIVQYDILAITIHHPEQVEYLLIEDIYL